MLAHAERGLVEGLAQYYTDRVLRRLERRYPGAVKAYEDMLPWQPEVYRTHIPWVQDFSPEAMRLAMLEVRRWKVGRLADFCRRLEEAQERLHPTRTLEREAQIPNNVSQKWKSFLEFAKKRNPTKAILFEHGKPIERTDDSVSVEYPNKSFYFERMQEADSRKALDTLLSEFSGQPMKGHVVGKP
jgi:hypothetical protein